MRRRFCRLPASTGRWLAAPVSRQRISSRFCNRRHSANQFGASRFLLLTQPSCKAYPRVMQAVLIIVHLFVAVALIFVVLLQRSEGGALGMGGGGSGLGGLFSPRGAASTLSRTTAILGIAFFATSLTLTILALGGRRPTSILNQTVPGTT